MSLHDDEPRLGHQLPNADRSAAPHSHSDSLPNGGTKDHSDPGLAQSRALHVKLQSHLFDGESNGTSQAALPRRSDRIRYSNGFTEHGSPSFHHHEKKPSLPTRRLSTTIHSSALSPTATASPTSPTQYSLPSYSHSAHGHRPQDKEQDGADSAGRVYTTAAAASSSASSSSSLSSTRVNGRSRTRSKSHPEPPNIPLMRACQSPSFGCSFSMAIVFVVTLSLLGCIFHSNFYHQVDPNGCMYTYMQPKYFKLLGFDRERTAFAGKYGLLLFRDQYDYKLPVPASMLTEYSSSVYTVDKEAKIQPLGIPALFIPGNAGSAKQMRSIAKEASKYYYENLAESQRNGRTLSRPIDFFTLDFNEEFSALHGHSLLEQAQFLNDAIAYILSLYDDNRHTDPALPRPTSVLLFGHSMGGIVARTLFTMSNYRPGTVNTILTAATPHMVPPVTLDFEISNIYDQIEDFWSRGYQGPDAVLSNVSLVSIAGGNLDIIVNGESGNIHNIVPQSHGFSVFTSSIPHAWVGSDHVSILWCNQIAIVLGKTLIDIVDASYPEQVKPLEERMKIFRNRLLTGIDDHLEDPLASKDEEVIVVAEIAHTVVDLDEPFVYPLKASTTHDVDSEVPHLYVIPIPRSYRDVDTLNLLTDHQLGPDSRLDLLLCSDVFSDDEAASTTPSRILCRYNTLSAIPIPASPTTTIATLHFGKPNRGQEFRFVSQKLEDLDNVHYVAVLDRGRKIGEPGFLIAEFAVEADNTFTAETTTWKLLNDGFRVHGFPDRPSLVSALRLPNIDNSLLTYTLTVDRQGCHVPERFNPMLRQSSWTMNEDRYSIDITSKESGIDINFHGDIPYFERVQLPGKKGIEFRFWMDPSCPVPLSLNLQVDKYGSLGKVMIRYRMVVLVFTFLVVVLTLRAQFRGFNKGEPFLPFGMMLSRLTRTTFLKFSALLAVIALVQSLQAKTTVVFENPVSPFSSSHPGGDAVGEIIGGPDGARRTDQGAYERMIAARIARSESWFSAIRPGDALLGGNDTFFWFLAPVFFQIAIGIVILIWIILNGLVRGVAGLLTFVSKKGGRFMIGKAIGNMLSKRSRGVRRRIITTIILFIMVATFVPYQFAFVVAVLVHIVSCVRSLLIAQASTSSQAQAAWDRHHYLMSIFVMFFLLLPCTLPVLMVWIRNLSVQWYEPFSSDHRLDYIAPFIFFVEAVTDGAMVPRTPEKGYAAITNGILNLITVFLIMFGVRYSWQIFFMSRIWIVWLLVLQLKDTEPAARVTRAVESRVRALMRPSKKRK
ncbi:GPI inositol deacylase [Dissophora globulifera]|uniref:GPI inositol-deacylase n=1 Tax=Dissophora globulifera TaxID=979702 RepID=A0A9P6RFM9_9FUNG|nr:GPI inositol deacylase [Dissophora globulifera]